MIADYGPFTAYEPAHPKWGTNTLYARDAEERDWYDLLPTLPSGWWVLVDDTPRTVAAAQDPSTLFPAGFRLQLWADRPGDAP